MLIKKSVMIRNLDTPEYADALTKCSAYFDEKTASKVFSTAVLTYPDMVDSIRSKNSEIRALRMEVERLNSVIESARVSAAVFLENISQKDMLV